MMIDPPIDKLIKKAECRYALCCGVYKRAKQLLTTDIEILEMSKKKAISLAAEEIYSGKIIVKRE